MATELRAVLAEYLDRDAATLTDEYRLSGGPFHGSVAMYKFLAFAKKRLQKPVPLLPLGCTLAEAEALLGGAPAGSIRPAVAEPRKQAPAGDGPQGSLGTDIEMVDSMPETHDYRSHEFYTENFTPAEIAYCLLKPEPRVHFCGLFCAKESLIKAVPDSAGLEPGNIEVTHDPSGRPYYLRAGGAEKPPYTLSISHSGSYAMAVAVASRAQTPPIPASAPEAAPQRPEAPPVPAPAAATLRRMKAWVVFLASGLGATWAAIAWLWLRG